MINDLTCEVKLHAHEQYISGNRSANFQINGTFITTNGKLKLQQDKAVWFSPCPSTFQVGVLHANLFLLFVQKIPS